MSALQLVSVKRLEQIWSHFSSQNILFCNCELGGIRVTELLVLFSVEESRTIIFELHKMEDLNVC